MQMLDFLITGQTIPDPFISPSSSNFSNASSLRVLFDRNQEIFISTTYQSKSTIQGLLGITSSMGGIFTILSRAFSVFFGRSIIAMVTGMQTPFQINSQRTHT
jgi:hypothetical protein